jgi:hypothetical protein
LCTFKGGEKKIIGRVRRNRAGRVRTKRIEGKGKKVRGEELEGLKWKGRKCEKGIRAGRLGR